MWPQLAAMVGTFPQIRSGTVRYDSLLNHGTLVTCSLAHVISPAPPLSVCHPSCPHARAALCTLLAFFLLLLFSETGWPCVTLVLLPNLGFHASSVLLCAVSCKIKSLSPGSSTSVQHISQGCAARLKSRVSETKMKNIKACPHFSTLLVVYFTKGRGRKNKKTFPLKRTLFTPFGPAAL